MPFPEFLGEGEKKKKKKEAWGSRVCSFTLVKDVRSNLPPALDTGSHSMTQDLLQGWGFSCFPFASSISSEAEHASQGHADIQKTLTSTEDINMTGLQDY